MDALRNSILNLTVRKLIVLKEIYRLQDFNKILQCHDIFPKGAFGKQSKKYWRMIYELNRDGLIFLVKEDNYIMDIITRREVSEILRTEYKATPTQIKEVIKEYFESTKKPNHEKI